METPFLSLGAYLKKFQIPLRMISRQARRATIVSLCKKENFRSKTVCNHTNLNKTFRTCQEHESNILNHNARKNKNRGYYCFLFAHHCCVVHGFVRNKKLVSQETVLTSSLKQSPVNNNVPVSSVKRCNSREYPSCDVPCGSSVNSISCSKTGSDDGQ